MGTTPGGVGHYLSEAADRDFANDAVYLQRHESYFDLWDDENCRRNYEAIRAI